MNTDKHTAAWKAILLAIEKKSREQGWNQARVAEEILGKNRSTVHCWFSKNRGGKRGSIDEMQSYMEKLGIDPTPYFGGGEGNEKFIEVPWLEATASMGGGSVEVSKKMISTLSFRSDWLHRKGNPGNMAVINASGGSMEPTIPDDSVVLIDESRIHDLVNGKVYFVCYEDQVFLKRLKIFGGKAVALVSDSTGEEQPIKPGAYFRILGRAIWYGKEL